MKLERTDINGQTSIIAEIKENEVVFLNQSIQRVIDVKGRVSLPHTKPNIDQFGSSIVKDTHPKWAKAVKIYLDTDWVSKDPEAYKWINTDSK